MKDIAPEKLVRVLSTLLADGELFVIQRKGDPEESYVHADYMAEILDDPTVESIIAAPHLLALHGVEVGV